MRIAIFGVGKFYVNRRDELMALCAGDEIVCFFDNKINQDIEIDHIPVKNPSSINSVKFDYIIIMSRFFEEIYNQLDWLGVDRGRILSWKRYRVEKTGGKIEYYKAEKTVEGKKVLIVTNPISYDGGSMVAVYAAMSLYSRGYCVWVTAEFVEAELKEKLLNNGINIAINHDIPFLGNTTKKWIESFSTVLVNLFPMIAAVNFVSEIKPTLWWIHEAGDAYSDVYKSTIGKYSQYADLKCFRNAYVVAVSNIAKHNFEKYYPNRVDSILAYGIPDEGNVIDKCVGKSKFVFAIIGNISELKAQHIFISAAASLAKDKLYNVEFWIIGQCGEDEYSKKIKSLIHDIPEIKLMGKMSRVELKRVFMEIDVVVCASMEETMSLAITEGMMHGKVCITTDATGMADYIKDGDNGFICITGNDESLYEKMIWILKHRSEIENIMKKARRTYEAKFTLNIFGKNLEDAINAAERKYEAMQ